MVLERITKIKEQASPVINDTVVDIITLDKIKHALDNCQIMLRVAYDFTKDPATFHAGMLFIQLIDLLGTQPHKFPFMTKVIMEAVHIGLTVDIPEDMQSPDLGIKMSGTTH
jgi:hypothetical protein